MYLKIFFSFEGKIFLKFFCKNKLYNFFYQILVKVFLLKNVFPEPGIPKNSIIFIIIFNQNTF